LRSDVAGTLDFPHRFDNAAVRTSHPVSTVDRVPRYREARLRTIDWRVLGAAPRVDGAPSSGILAYEAGTERTIVTMPEAANTQIEIPAIHIGP
jgi:hypothetical protein